MRHLSLRRFSAAIFLFISLLSCLRTAQAQPGQRPWSDTLVAKSLLEEAKQLNKQEKGEAALEKAQQSLAIYTDLYGQDHPKTAKPRLYVARELRNLRRNDEAAALLEHSLRVYEAAHDTIQMAICLNLLSTCRRIQHLYADARRHAQTALQLVRPDSASHRTLMADFAVTLAYAFDEEKNYLAARPLLEAAKALYLLKNNTSALGTVSYHLGEAYFGLHDYVRAKENYLTASAYLKSELQSDHSYFADLLVNVGLCCQKAGDPKLALNYLLQAKEAYLKSKADSLNYWSIKSKLSDKVF